jgi:hypothetical protein
VRGKTIKMKELIAVAVMMGGRPARTYLPVVLETLDALQG